jgi:hypothetical protein
MAHGTRKPDPPGTRARQASHPLAEGAFEVVTSPFTVEFIAQRLALDEWHHVVQEGIRIARVVEREDNRGEPIRCCHLRQLVTTMGWTGQG